MSIYIIAHKKFKCPVNDKIYKTMQVGADINDVISAKWCMDNTGDNISKKNKSYNELTGLYWIWKNATDDVVGLCHYRRYFVKPLGKVANIVFGKKCMFTDRNEIEKILSKYDLIVHNKTYFAQGCKNQYIESQKYPNDIDVLREVLVEDYPEYVDGYDKVMNGKACHLLNMMIGKKEIVDKYCEWLFDVLFKVEDKLREKGETSFDRRMGMLGERMLDIWIVKNEIKIKEMFSINTERRDLRAW